MIAFLIGVVIGAIGGILVYHNNTKKAAQLLNQAYVSAIAARTAAEKDLVTARVELAALKAKV